MTPSTTISPPVDASDIAPWTGAREFTIVVAYPDVSLTTWKMGRHESLTTKLVRSERTRRENIPEEVTEEYTQQYGWTYEYALTFATVNNSSLFLGQYDRSKTITEGETLSPNDFAFDHWRFVNNPLQNVPLDAETVSRCSRCNTRRHKKLVAVGLPDKETGTVHVRWVGVTCFTESTQKLLNSELYGSFEKFADDGGRSFYAQTVTIPQGVAGFLLPEPRFVESPEGLSESDRHAYETGLLTATVLVESLKTSLSPSDEWERKLLDVVNVGWCTRSQSGLLKTLPGKYRHLVISQQGEEDYGFPTYDTPYANEWLGEAGERVRSFCRVERSFRKERNDDASSYQIVNLRDLETNCKMTWFTDTYQPKAGDCLYVSFTVKKRDAFRGEKSVVVSKVRFLDPPDDVDLPPGFTRTLPKQEAVIGSSLFTY